MVYIKTWTDFETVRRKASTSRVCREETLPLYFGA
jgi:hypothetical protein